MLISVGAERVNDACLLPGYPFFWYFETILWYDYVRSS